MNKNEMEFACSEKQFIDLLKITLENYKSAWYDFRMKESGESIVLKPHMKIQKGTSFVNCKFSLVSLNDRCIRVKVNYRLTLIPMIFILFLPFILYQLVTEIINNFGFETLYGIFVFITVPTFFYLKDKIACSNFIKHFFGKLKLLYKEIEINILM